MKKYKENENFPSKSLYPMMSWSFLNNFHHNPNNLIFLKKPVIYHQAIYMKNHPDDIPSNIRKMVCNVDQLPFLGEMSSRSNDRTQHTSIFWDKINCYHHQFSLVLRRGDKTANILHIRKGVTQGYPLVMVAYRIGILPLTKRLNLTYPDIPQPQ